MRPEVRMARYVEALERYRGGRLICMEAAEVLGISERHFRRLRERYEADGAEGLIDRRRGRAPGGARRWTASSLSSSSIGRGIGTSRSSTFTKRCRPSTGLP